MCHIFGTVYFYLLDVFLIHTTGSRYLFSNEMARDYILTVGSHKILTDLLVLNTPSYDIILGMNWLFKNSLQIDCAKHHILIYEEVLPIFVPPEIEKDKHN